VVNWLAEKTEVLHINLYLLFECLFSPNFGCANLPEQHPQNPNWSTYWGPISSSSSGTVQRLGSDFKFKLVANGAAFLTFRQLHENAALTFYGC